MQLTIFDVLQEEFNPGDTVRVVELNDDMNAETHHYLSLFQGKRGLITKVIPRPILQYEIDFNGRLAIVHHVELEGVA